MTCRDVMTADPACCTPGDSVVTAAMLMKSHNVGSVPVISDHDSRRVVGIITDRDIAMRIVAEQREYYGARVEDAMSRHVVTCNADDDFDEVTDAMAKQQIRRVPVVDERKRLVGIIAQADVAAKSSSRDTGNVVGQISQTPMEHMVGRAVSATVSSLLVVGGLGLGAGLVYWLLPEWRTRAKEAVSNAVDSIRSAANDAGDAIRDASDSLGNTASSGLEAERPTSRNWAE